MSVQAAAKRWSDKHFAALLLALTPIYFFIPITHDAAWQMWIGRQMAHGADLYTDIIEVNPPLWFWVSVPLAEIAEMLHVRSLAVLITFFLVAIAFSLFLARRVKASNAPLWPMAIALLFPLKHFAQREHFILIFAIPYILLIARRERGESVSTQLAATIGACGAVAFALKPQFAVVPLLLELWAWRALRVRPETIALGLGAIIYVAATLAFETDFVTAAIPLVLAAYENFAHMDAESIGRSLIPYAYAVPLLLYARREAAAFTISSLGFYLVYLAQSKGWEYQVIPAQGTLFIAVVLAATGSTVRKTLGLAAGCLVLLPHLKPYETPKEFRVHVPAGTSFAALSISPRAGWPLAEESRLKWTLPYMSLWMAPTIMPPLANELACNPPNLLMIDDRKVNFSRRVEPILNSYQQVAQNGRIRLFRRVRDLNHPPGCRRIY